MKNTLVVYPGSWSPLHAGHLEIAHDINKSFNCGVLFELCKESHDKGTISQEEIDKRKKQFSLIGRRLIVTSNTSFVEKAINGAEYFEWEGFDDSEWSDTRKLFAVGFDTIKRVDDTKYYFDSIKERDRAIGLIGACGWKFIVYPRIGYVMDKDSISSGLKDLCEWRDDFVGLDISSSKLRSVSTVHLGTLKEGDYFEYKGDVYKHCGQSFDEGKPCKGDIEGSANGLLIRQQAIELGLMKDK